MTHTCLLHTYNSFPPPYTIYGTPICITKTKKYMEYPYDMNRYSKYENSIMRPYPHCIQLDITQFCLLLKLAKAKSCVKFLKLSYLSVVHHGCCAETLI